MQPGGRVISTPSPPRRPFATPRRACTSQHWDVPTVRRQPRRPPPCHLAAGAAITAAHPHGEERAPTPGRRTRGVYVDPQHMRDLVDRYELVNRHDVFAWVARVRLPSVACGDTHLAEHVLTWKSLLAC